MTLGLPWWSQWLSIHLLTQGAQPQSLVKGLDPTCRISEFVCAATKDLTCCSEDQRSRMPQGRPSAAKQKQFKNISHESLEQWLA